MNNTLQNRTTYGTNTFCAFQASIALTRAIRWRDAARNSPFKSCVAFRRQIMRDNAMHFRRWLAYIE